MWAEDEPDVFKRNAFKICQDFLAGPWLEASLDDFHLKKVSGGLSNKLYHCSISCDQDSENCTKTPSEVLLRIFGQLRDQNADNYLESVVQDSLIYMQLAERHLGPKLYGVFSDGRLEEYIPSIILSSDNMRNMSQTVAREMAKIHSLHPPVRKTTNTFFEHCESWLQKIDETNDLNGNDITHAVKHLINSKQLWTEAEWLHDLVRHKDYPVAFCHNDLQGGNVLLPVDDKSHAYKVFFIDFEFAYYNYRGFDIANHFCEWCFDYNTPDPPHFECDLEKFPNRCEQESFIEAYLDQLEEEGHIFANRSSREKEKQSILEEVQIFRMFSHLYWTIWSLKLALVKTNELKFEFMVHGETRFKFYNMCKDEFIENVRNKSD